MSSVTLVLNSASSPESPVSRGCRQTLDWNLVFRTMLLWFWHCLPVPSLENEEESNERWRLLPQINKYFNLIPINASFFLHFPFFFFPHTSRPKQLLTIWWHHKLTSKSGASCGHFSCSTKWLHTRLASTFGEERTRRSSRRHFTKWLSTILRTALKVKQKHYADGCR